MEKKYEFLEHTADTKIRAYGKTLEEAFNNAAIATCAVMTNPELVEEKEFKEIKITSKNQKSLLYDFLEEILFLLDTEGLLIKKTNNLKIISTKSIPIKKELEDIEEKFELTCILIGDYAKKYDVHTTIKAITYSEMEITKQNELYTIQIVHDL